MTIRIYFQTGINKFHNQPKNIKLLRKKNFCFYYSIERNIAIVLEVDQECIFPIGLATPKCLEQKIIYLNVPIKYVINKTDFA